MSRRPLRLALAVAAALLAACSSSSSTGPATETPAQVAARVAQLEREKNEIAFGADKSEPRVARFTSFYAPSFRSVNLGPTGVTLSAYADLVPQLRAFPPIPFTLTEMETVAADANTVVTMYVMALTTPMGPVRYRASSTWARQPDGTLRTIYYQATPLP